MKIANYRDSQPVEEVQGVFKREIITAEDGAENFTMRIFEVEPSSSTPTHSHSWEHEVFVLSGKGVVVGAQGAAPVGKDSVVFVAPSEPHCFVNTGDEPLRFVCVIPLAKSRC
jgi:quercetin dioxygenase-like cupin family protein